MLARPEKYSTETLPISPIDARLAPGWPAWFRNYGSELLPVRRGEKIPAVSGWREHVVTKELCKAWEAQRTSVGMQGRKFPALDIDIDDETLANKISTLAGEHFGFGPVRGRPGSPRVLHMLRLCDGAAPLRKVRQEFHDRAGTTYRVELLGEGQQYVVEGLHPKGDEYDWGVGEHPCDCGPEGLPAITAEDVQRFFAALRGALLEAGCTIEASTEGSTSGHRRSLSDPSGWAPTPQNVLDLLATWRPEEMGHDDFVRAIAAIKWALGPDREEHYGAVLEWAPGIRSTEYDETRKRWDSITDSALGWSWLASAAGRGDIAAQADFADPPPDIIDALRQATADTIKAHTPDLAMLRYGWQQAYADEITKLESRGVITRGELDALLESESHKYRVKESDQKSSVAIGPFNLPDAASITPRQWLYGTCLIRGYLSLLVAPGGSGKSSLVITETLAMVAGRPLLWDMPAGMLRVFYWNGEDPHEEIERRVVAACLHYKISRADLGDRLFIASGRDLPITLASENKNGFAVSESTYRVLVDFIRQHQIDVVIFDPFVALHGVSENDNVRINAVCRQLAKIADEPGCAIQLVHHTRKPSAGQGGYTADDARGAGATVAAARSVRVITSVTADEANKAHVKDRWQFFRVEDGKANLARRAENTTWRQIISVPLGNSRGETKGDSVGVVVPWHWPDPSADMDREEIESIQAAIAAGEWRENSQAADWVGKAVADAMDLDLSEPAGKEAAKRYLEVLIDNGYLEIAEHNDNKRKQRKFVTVGKKVSQ
jgi:RecA-family ATPase